MRSSRSPYASQTNLRNGRCSAHPRVGVARKSRHIVLSLVKIDGPGGTSTRVDRLEQLNREGSMLLFLLCFCVIAVPLILAAPELRILLEQLVRDRRKQPVAFGTQPVNE